ncbi:protein TIC 214-like [Cyprinus carpio]|uniref:Protein TIC 214-like n=1 Tax=Cyprinus carpio TaxID=7962 RepID=A0A9Q9XZ93_CYPCA|nr:protein TIC 214-like [Cyprinus carpio]
MMDIISCVQQPRHQEHLHYNVNSWFPWEDGRELGECNAVVPWLLVPDTGTRARDLNARDVDARDLDARDLDAWDLDTRDLDTWDLDTGDLDARDLDARDLDTRDLTADAEDLLWF